VQFFPVTSDTLAGAIAYTAELFADGDVWKRMQANGMRTDVSWRGPARRYAALYRAIAAG
jgi:starch synthase